MSRVEARNGPEADVRRATLEAIRRARTRWSGGEERVDEGPETAAELEEVKPPRDGRIPGARSRGPGTYATSVDCPGCGEGIVVDPSSSILQSTRCGECGRILAFDEMVDLRAKEVARARRYL